MSEKPDRNTDDTAMLSKSDPKITDIRTDEHIFNRLLIFPE
ncbi:Uncharacterized protein dnm_032160 [Desulfonema magnum]|uniref:Uncharacterized protein n=1 Tax=Desulfonema magnum TaxID=45655 RepID=A0A975BKQ4_9BACT|nr:Uncharacterized protein dnm_032160 [Desulfonema magnum]